MPKMFLETDKRFQSVEIVSTQTDCFSLMQCDSFKFSHHQLSNVLTSLEAMIISLNQKVFQILKNIALYNSILFIYNLYMVALLCIYWGRSDYTLIIPAVMDI